MRFPNLRKGAGLLNLNNETILVAIGANLPGPGGRTPLATCRAAVAALARLPGLNLAGLSHWYETAPMPPSGQPPYINGVARLSGHASDPVALLAALHAIEAAAGRVRGEPNAPRTLDLDIIAIGNLRRDSPDPIIPHPRAHLRAFVLQPLAEVAPDWVHPILQQTAGELLAGVAGQGIKALT